MGLLSPARTLALAACAALVLSPAAAAQANVEDRAVNVAVNAGLGGAISWTRAAIAGKPSARAFARGAAGGALVSAGRQVVGSRAPGSAYVGRHLALVGIGIADAAVTDTFVWRIPIGPVTLAWTPAARRVRARVNAAETLLLAYYATLPRVRLDVEGTLALGVPAFTRWGLVDRDSSDGASAARMVVISTESEDPALTRAHELIHVMQADQIGYAVAEPLEAAARSRVPRVPIPRYVETGVAGVLLEGAVYLLPYCGNPLESEAFTLTEGRGWRADYCE